MKKRGVNVAKAKKKSKAPAKKVSKKASVPKAKTKKTSARKALVQKASSKRQLSSKSGKAVKKAVTPAKGMQKASKRASSGRAPSKATAAKASPPMDWAEFVTPLDDRMVVEISSAERMTAGGLYIPDSVADASGNFKGKVVIAGRGHRDDKGRIRPMDVRRGDTILFAQYAGSKVELMGKEVVILRESEVLGILEKK
jgi:chaperonin GroES